jgi:hypothetical protein
MRKIYFLILFIIVSGCSDVNKETVPVDKNTLVFGKKNELSVMIDKNWRVIPSDYSELQLSGRAKHHIEFNVSSYDGGFDKKTDDILKEFISKEKFRFESKSDVTVDSVPSLFVSLAFYEIEENRFYNIYLIPLKNKFIDIIVSAPEDYFNEVYVENLLDTLTIIGKKDIPKEKPTKRPFFFPEKVLKSMDVFNKRDTLTPASLNGLVKIFDELLVLDEDFRKTKEIRVFRKKSGPALQILNKYGFKSLYDYEMQLNKGIAGLMVINYLSESDENSVSVENNLSREIIIRNKLSINDIRAVYGSYTTILNLEKKMRF